MTADAEVFFDEQKLEDVFNVHERKFVEGKIVPFFHLRRASIADRDAEPTAFDGPATEEHKKHYPGAWDKFCEATGHKYRSEEEQEAIRAAKLKAEEEKKAAEEAAAKSEE